MLVHIGGGGSCSGCPCVSGLASWLRWPRALFGGEAGSGSGAELGSGSGGGLSLGDSSFIGAAGNEARCSRRLPLRLALGGVGGAVSTPTTVARAFRVGTGGGSATVKSDWRKTAGSSIASAGSDLDFWTVLRFRPSEATLPASTPDKVASDGLAGGSGTAHKEAERRICAVSVEPSSAGEQGEDHEPAKSGLGRDGDGVLWSQRLSVGVGGIIMGAGKLGLQTVGESAFSRAGEGQPLPPRRGFGRTFLGGAGSFGARGSRGAAAADRRAGGEGVAAAGTGSSEGSWSEASDAQGSHGAGGGGPKAASQLACPLEQAPRAAGIAALVGSAAIPSAPPVTAPRGGDEARRNVHATSEDSLPT